MKTVRLYIQTAINLQRKCLENSRLQNHGKYVERIHLTKYTGYISHTNNFVSLWMRYGSTQVTQIPLVHSGKLVANSGNTAYVVDVIEDDKLMYMPQQPDDLADSHHCYYIMGQCHNNAGAIRRPLGNQLNQAAPDCMQAQKVGRLGGSVLITDSRWKQGFHLIRFMIYDNL